MRATTINKGNTIMRTMFAGLLACLAGMAPVQAGPYPDRPVTIIVPFGKGTTADLIAAVVSEAVAKNIGQKIVVELKPGAGGGIAGAGRAGRARRLYAGDDHAGHACLQSQPLQDAALRSAKDRSHHADRRGLQRDDRASVQSGEYAA
jgi:hypothetical protein